MRTWIIVVSVFLTPMILAGGAPPNDDCANATVIGTGSFAGDTTSATIDGSAELDDCSDIQLTPDVWYSFTAPENCELLARTCNGASWDTAVSIHSGCPGTTANELACNDDACSLLSSVSFSALAGQTYKIHVTGYRGESGPFTLVVSCDAGPAAGIDAMAAEVSLFDQFGREGNVMAFNMFRLENDRLLQVGQSWVKHTFGAADENDCGLGCVPTGTNQSLGVGCSDIYNINTNAAQSLLGPRSEINPWTGEFTYAGSHIDTHSGSHDSIDHRLQLTDDDLDSTQHPGASYFSEFYIVVPGDVDHMNNVSWEPVTVAGIPGGTWFFDVSSPAQVGLALDNWTGSTQTVIPATPVSDGRSVLATKVTDNGNGTWHYEYALYNLDMHRGVGSFSVPVMPATTVTNVGFLAVASAGEIFDNDPWTWVRAGSQLIWSTDPFAIDPTANPLRWGTMYNFYFDADVAPVSSAATLSAYEPGTPDLLSGSTEAPASAAVCALPDGQSCTDGNACTESDVCFSGFCSGTLTPPSEVSPPVSPLPLLFQSNTALTWEPSLESCTATFNLYRGPISDMAIGEYGCPIQSGLTTHGTDIGGDAPAPGTVWGYLVTGENALGEGTLGGDSDGAVRNATSPCGA